MKKAFLMVLLLISAALVFSACGGGNGESESATQADKPQAEKPDDTAGKGEEVAKEILAAFDQLVADTAELVKEKPEAAEVKPKIEQLFKDYEPKIAELNSKYLALRDEDIALFGEANGYLGENRGKHVFKKDEVLQEYLDHYYSKGEQELYDLLKKGLINFLDMAVKR